MSDKSGVDYKNIAYEALQRVSVSTTWTEDAIERVENYLKGVLEEKITIQMDELKLKIEKGE